ERVAVRVRLARVRAHVPRLAVDGDVPAADHVAIAESLAEAPHGGVGERIEPAPGLALVELAPERAARLLVDALRAPLDRKRRVGDERHIVAVEEAAPRRVRVGRVRPE